MLSLVLLFPVLFPAAVIAILIWFVFLPHNVVTSCILNAYMWIILKKSSDLDACITEVFPVLPHGR